MRIFRSPVRFAPGVSAVIAVLYLSVAQAQNGALGPRAEIRSAPSLELPG